MLHLVSLINSTKAYIVDRTAEFEDELVLVMYVSI